MDKGQKRLVAAVDFGTGGGRCSVYDTAGTLVSNAYRSWSYVQPDTENPAVREFDADTTWDIICDLTSAAVAEAVQITGGTTADVVAISATSQREGIVLLDGEGRELYAGPNIDYRGHAHNSLLAEQFGDDVYSGNGHWPTDIFAVGRLWWLKDKKPELYSRIRTLLSINDWVLYRLSGVARAEPTNAAETLLLSLKTLDWNGDLCRKCGIPAEILPAISPAGTLLGTVTAEAAQRTGLAAGTKVVIAGADTQCALLGSGVTRPGTVCIVAGSTTPVQLVTGFPILDNKRRTWTNPHVYPGRWVLEANASLTGFVFRWLRETFYPELSEEEATAAMLREAGSASPGPDGPFAFLGPHIWNAAARRPVKTLVLGLRPDSSFPGGRAQLVRAFLENIAYAIRANIELVSEVAGQPHVHICMTGGGSRHPLLPGILAAVLGRSIALTTQAESSSFGAAVCAAVGAGLFRDFDSAIGAMAVGTKEVAPCDAMRFLPTDTQTNPYPDLYRRWLRLYNQVFLPSQSTMN